MTPHDNVARSTKLVNHHKLHCFKLMYAKERLHTLDINLCNYHQLRKTRLIALSLTYNRVQWINIIIHNLRNNNM